MKQLLVTNWEFDPKKNDYIKKETVPMLGSTLNEYLEMNEDYLVQALPGNHEYEKDGTKWKITFEVV